MLQIEALAKSYDGTPVFAGVTLALQRGEFVAMLGESGVGKSTLLNCIAGLDRPDRGRIVLDGEELGALDDDASARLRRTRLGFVFQAFHVLPHLSVFHNVALPLLLLETPDAARVNEMLAAVGLLELAERLPQQLSDGQLQRVAIARALVHRPALILADEPTGNLDPTTAERVIDLLAAQVKHEGAACVLATHSRMAAARADRVLTLTGAGIVPA